MPDQSYCHVLLERRGCSAPGGLFDTLDYGCGVAQNEWRAIGVQQSRGWVHYAIHRPEPHIMLFRRPLNYQQNQENQVAQQMLAKWSIRPPWSPHHVSALFSSLLGNLSSSSVSFAVIYFPGWRLKPVESWLCGCFSDLWNWDLFSKPLLSNSHVLIYLASSLHSVWSLVWSTFLDLVWGGGEGGGGNVLKYQPFIEISRDRTVSHLRSFELSQKIYAPLLELLLELLWFNFFCKIIQLIIVFLKDLWMSNKGPNQVFCHKPF